MKKIVRLLFQIVLLISLSGPVLAASSLLIQEMKFTPLDNSNEWVTFQLNGTYTPKPFTIKGERPRVVFDFHDTGISRNVGSIHAVNGHLVKRIRIGLHQNPSPKARVVFDLQPDPDIAFDFRFDEQKQALNIHFFRQGQKSEAADIPVYTEETAPAASAPAPPQEQEEVAASVPQEAQDQAAGVAAKEPAQPTLSPKDDPSEAQMMQQIVTEEQTSVEPEMTEVEPEPASTAKPAGTTQEPFLKSVDFDGSSNRGEMVLFKLNDFYPPVVFGIEEGLPRVVCDFKNTLAGPEVKNEIKANGQFVKTVRIGKHRNPDKVRVVLDLEPNNNYDLQQVFFKEDNLFVIIVNTLKATPPADRQN